MKYLILIFLLISCFQKKEDKDLSQITVPLSSDISSLDPAVAFDEISLRVIYQVYETLFQYDYHGKNHEIIPLLAERMPKVSKDRLTYTFKIKKNIQYHPHPALSKTRKVKAVDFINQIKRIAFLPTKSQGFWLFDNKVLGINEFRKSTKTLDEMFKAEIEGIKLIDDHTFSIKLLKPFPQMVYAMAMVFITPIPEEVIRHHNNFLTDTTIGTGPFFIKKMHRSHKVTLSKFKSYHDSRYPKVDQVEMPIIKEGQTTWLNFLKKKVDFFGVGNDHYSVVLNQKGELKKEFSEQGIQLKKSPSLTYWWISFNMEDPLLGKNKDLRMAIAYAFNTDKFLSMFTNNTGIKANSIYHPFVFGYNPNRKLPFSYDINKAKEYLKKAGFPQGKGLPVLNFDTRSNDHGSLQRAEFLKSELQKIGIKVKIIGNNFPTFLSKAKNGKLQFWQDGWSLDYPDSENTLQLLLKENHAPGPNASFYNNPEVNALIKKVATLENSPEKRILMRDIEDRVLDDYVWLMQFYSQKFILHHDRIKEYRPSSLVNNALKYYSIRQ